MRSDSKETYYVDVQSPQYFKKLFNGKLHPVEWLVGLGMTKTLQKLCKEITYYIHIAQGKERPGP